MRTTRRVMKKLMAAACYQTWHIFFSPDCFSLDRIDSHCRPCLRRSKSSHPSWQVIKRSKDITKETAKTVFWPHILLMKGRFNLGNPISSQWRHDTYIIIGSKLPSEATEDDEEHNRVKAFHSGRRAFALLSTLFGDSLVQDRGTSWLTRGRPCAANVTPRTKRMPWVVSHPAKTSR